MEWLEFVNSFLQFFNWFSPILLGVYVYLKYRSKLKQARARIEDELEKLKKTFDVYSEILSNDSIQKYIEQGCLQEILKNAATTLGNLVNEEPINVSEVFKPLIKIPKRVKKNMLQTIDPNVDNIIRIVTNPPKKAIKPWDEKTRTKKDEILRVYKKMAEIYPDDNWWKERQEKLAKKLDPWEKFKIRRTE